MRESGIRVAVVLLIIVGYFFLLRPFRASVNKVVLTPVVENITETNEAFSLSGGVSSVSNLILVKGFEKAKQIYIKVPFGLHFLLALIGFAVIGVKGSFYGYLALIQLAGGLTVLLTFYLGSVISIYFLILTDFIARYLIPLCSLGLVPLAFIIKKQMFHERQAP